MKKAAPMWCGLFTILMRGAIVAPVLGNGAFKALNDSRIGAN
ncbi:hypothetical protein K08M4_05800 [Vibrio syngnathi]|uniref:Uncharacterized protein n=1 Tax=Vibrio syngnathi TaxID=3034029 RepID=A0AA34TM03_9VIBR|nr:hypothetical protein K08M4_05800 [Vibrio syngnathi]